MAAPVYCRKCGTRLPPESQFCPACGASQSAIDYIPTNQSSSQEIHAGTGRLPTGSLLRERYRLLHTVGQGGMGAVYVAQDTQLGDRLVAVKEMSMSRLAPQELPHAVEQFKREAHLLANLHHHHLPIIYEYFGEAERWYLVMSFIEGSTLQAYLDATEGKKLPIDEVVRIGMELCDVLDYLHSHQPQIIFRDLKPSNIMFTPRKEVYLIDFGIARHFKQNQAKDTAHYYSAGYAPPEQYGQSQTGPRSDIYSLGATLHQMLSGRNPSSHPFQFPALHMLDTKIPVPLAELIAQMLEMNEQRRPVNVAEVKERLAKVPLPGPVKESSRGDEKKKESEKKKGGEERKEEEEKKEKVQTRQHLWGRINAFFSKRRMLAWLVFILLSLIIGFRVGSFILYVDHGRGYDHALWLVFAGIGAAGVGLIFFLAKRRALLDML
ncbi:MAG TPA: serine/threonine-protein kinase, partial [Ktedonosporobacter sp.]|nr:serine/threonine-protein kinase [Ktedonosporobacter sp.]